MNITRIPETHDRGYRLGRHVRHDPRSAAYALPAMPRTAIKSVTWERHIPILNQGQVGSCVPNTGTEYLACDSLGYTGAASTVVQKTDTQGEFKAGESWDLDEDFALQLYRLLTRIDSYPGQWEPDDTGSDGLTLGKGLVMLGVADKYDHAFTYKSAVSALQSGPVCFGTVWYNSMFDPKPDGEIVVDPKSGVAGGHEYLSRQFDADQDRVWIDNSWDTSWGLDGRAWISGKGMTALLKAQGDVTVPHLLGAAPTPTPTPPPADPDMAMALAARAWLTAKGL
ncbi:hypothetical protein AB0M11_26675 [Streptomyces sp. NPDC051987]|uniref:hypothetical protein n=1 Tax=Streptomyces sp. NPDC051987 TaxID=3155808 RepID=UPI00342B63AB